MVGLLGTHISDKRVLKKPDGVSMPREEGVGIQWIHFVIPSMCRVGPRRCRDGAHRQRKNFHWKRVGSRRRSIAGWIAGSVRAVGHRDSGERLSIRDRRWLAKVDTFTAPHACCSASHPTATTQRWPRRQQGYTSKDPNSPQPAEGLICITKVWAAAAYRKKGRSC